jgi:Fur family transcriptional regulator, ferric uptake regulator
MRRVSTIETSYDARESLHETAERRLRGLEQRYTEGRRAVVEALAGAGRPLSIEDIGVVVPQLPRSSAYRHLVDLQAAGVVRRVAAHDEFARFELAEDLTEHHHHLLCTTCGKLIDVTPADEFEATVRATVEELSAAEGFRPLGHRLDVLGVCADCQ